MGIFKGDRLTDERIQAAQSSMVNGEKSIDRLEGFISKIEDFHRLMNFLEVTIHTCIILYWYLSNVSHFIFVYINIPHSSCNKRKLITGYSQIDLQHRVWKGSRDSLLLQK